MWPWLSSAAFMSGQLYSHLYQRYSNVLDCANSSWWSWEACFQNPLLTGLWVRSGQKRTQCQIWQAEWGPQPLLWGALHRQILWQTDMPTDWSQLILKTLVSHSDHPAIHSRPSLLQSRPPSGTVSFLELPDFHNELYSPEWTLTDTPGHKGKHIGRWLRVWALDSASQGWGLRTMIHMQFLAQCMPHSYHPTVW